MMCLRHHQTLNNAVKLTQIGPHELVATICQNFLNLGWCLRVFTFM